MDTSLHVSELYPFPGLRPFQEGEEHYFFGRENQTDTLIDTLRETHFLAVIGSSGSGKSSLVNCGLMTALQGGLMPDAGTAWRIASCRPAGQPIRSLANALAAPSVLFDDAYPDGMSLVDVIDSSLHMSKHGIIDVFNMARVKPNVNLLIVVDQFEELFRYRAADSSKDASPELATAELTEFIKLLLGSLEHEQQRIYIVLTMRSDFLGECTRIEGLAEAINKGQYLVPRMSREERRLAISGPVEVAGAQIDPVLLTRLVNDLGDDPDQLSILQHALNRIWARWQSLERHEDPLGLSHYSSIGSMKEALNQHAEEAFSELKTERDRVLCEKVFKALTNKATDHRGVRRPTTLAVLCKLTQASFTELQNVIDVFRKPSRSFLMPPANKPLEPVSVVDISHESFMRMWKRLVTWSNEEAESTHIFQRLSNTAELHANAQAGLWRDPDLQIALEWRLRDQPNECWASRIRPGFEQAMIFLDSSREANDLEAEEIIKRAEQERELESANAIAREQKQTLEAQATAVRKQRQVIGLTTCGLIVTGALMFYAMQQKNLAEQKNKELVNEKYVTDTVIPLFASSISAKEMVDSENEARRMIIAQAIDLLNQQRVTDSNQSSRHSFVNQGNSDVMIFKVDGQGYLSQPMTVPSEETRMLTGYNQQIWIARELPSLKALQAGTFDHEGTSTFSDSLTKD